MNGYQLTDAWFEFRFQNPDNVSHAHTELYFYLVYHWNKLSQKEKFGLPSAVTMEATGIRNYKTYRKCLLDLVQFGFITVIQEAKNQHQSIIVAWGKNTEALTEALPKAVTKAQTEALPHIVELNNIGTKELNKAKKPDFDFSAYDAYSKLVQDWVNYRKSIKKPYKSQNSIDAFVKSLRKMSNDNIQLAEEIILQSMASEWQGIFPLKNQNSQNRDVPAEPASRKVHESFNL